MVRLKGIEENAQQKFNLRSVFHLSGNPFLKIKLGNFYLFQKSVNPGDINLPV